jgi:uncharacterized protein DUF4349
MNAPTHPVAPEEVMAILDGELSVERAQSVSAHVNECAECGRTRDLLRSASQPVLEWTVPSVPARMEDRVRQASAALQRTPQDDLPQSVRRFLRGRPSLAWGGAAVLAALLIFLGLSSQRRYKVSPASTHSVRTDDAQQMLAGRGSLGKLEQKAPENSPVGFDRILTLPLAERGRNPIGGVMGDALGGVSINGPMIARTVSLSIVVKDFDAGRASLDAILARHNGYAANLNVSTPQGAARALQASLRIPAPQLAAAVSELRSLGRVEGEAQNGEEVTQQHADLVVRLKNSRETEQRLEDVLRTRTGKVKDVLEVEQEIARVRGEIEQMEAEQKMLEHRVDFATIDLKLAEEYKAQLSTPAPSVAIQVRNAIINGFRNAFESFLTLVLFFAESGPSLLLWLVLLGVPAWRLWRRYRRAQSLGSLAGA